LAPGDSVQVPLDDYTVTPQNSGGGSNVIVIWPTAPGTQPEDSAGGTYWVDEIVGLNEILPPSQSSSLYPNPGSGIFQIRKSPDMPLEGSTLRVYQPNGQFVTSREINLAGVLDLNELPEGLYFYRILFKDQLADTGRILVKRN